MLLIICVCAKYLQVIQRFSSRECKKSQLRSTEATMKPFSSIPLCLPSALLTLAVELTQNMDPQYSSRAAAHMVHTHCFSHPCVTRQPDASQPLLHRWVTQTLLLSPLSTYTPETIAGCDSEGLWAIRLLSREQTFKLPCAEKRHYFSQRCNGLI